MEKDDVAVATMFDLVKRVYTRVDDFTDRLENVLYGDRPKDCGPKEDPMESLQGVTSKLKDIHACLDRTVVYLKALEEKQTQEQPR